MMQRHGLCATALFLAAVGTFVLLGPGRARAQAIPDVSELIANLGSSNATARATAACYLGRMQASDVRQGQELLLGMLTDGLDVEGRLCRDQDHGWNRFESDESSPGREAAIALEELGDEVLGPLVEILGGENSVGQENAALALGLIENSAAIEPLTSTLEEAVAPAVRSRAAWALGMIESGSAVSGLARALRDENAAVREQAAWALGMIESPEGVEGLISLLDDASAAVREQAAWALGMIESGSAVSGLGRAIRDENAAVREQAAWALGMIESSAGVEGLISLLDDVSADVREQAAWALGMIEDPTAADALVEALEDPDPEVREEAMWALGMVLRSGAFDRIDREELSETIREALRDMR